MDGDPAAGMNGVSRGWRHRHRYGRVRPEATIDVAAMGKNRMGAECYCGTLKCLFGGTKSEQRFKFRHRFGVSNRALGGVLPGTDLLLEGFELAGHGLGAQIEMRAVPGRNARSQNDGLGRLMRHADSLCDVA